MVLGCCAEAVGPAGSTLTKNPHSSADECCCVSDGKKPTIADGSCRDDKDSPWKDDDMSESLSIVDEDAYKSEHVGR